MLLNTLSRYHQRLITQNKRALASPLSNFYFALSKQASKALYAHKYIYMITLPNYDKQIHELA